MSSLMYSECFFCIRASFLSLVQEIQPHLLCSFISRRASRSPEQKINYLYRKIGKIRNIRKMLLLNNKECLDNILDLYHRRNCNEGINSYLKDHLEVEVHVNGKGIKNIDLHVTECCIATLAEAFVRLQ